MTERRFSSGCVGCILLYISFSILFNAIMCIYGFPSCLFHALSLTSLPHRYRSTLQLPRVLCDEAKQLHCLVYVC